MRKRRSGVWRRNPNIDHEEIDIENTVSGRIVSKKNGVFIDVFTSVLKKYDMLVSSWNVNKPQFWQKKSDVFPLNRVTFASGEYPAPGNLKAYLMRRYEGYIEVPDSKKDYIISE